MSLIGVPVLSNAQDNAELGTLVAADQRPRTGNTANVDWTRVAAEDTTRRIRVLDLLHSAKVRTPTDYYNAALIFQHGLAVEDIRLAYSLATVAYALDQNLHDAKWLSAAAWDRMLMMQGRPQWYGTQFVRHDKEPFELYVVDETAVTDEDRRAFGVPTLAESRAKAASMK